MAEETLPEMKSFCSIEWANAFFESFLWNSNWVNADDSKRKTALSTATNLIQRFCLFYDEQGEIFEFDLDSENNFPDSLKEATAKEAIYLLSLEESPIEPNPLLTMGIQSANGVVFSKDFQGDIIPVSVRSLIFKMGGEVLPEAIAPSEDGSLVQGRTSR